MMDNSHRYTTKQNVGKENNRRRNQNRNGWMPIINIGEGIVVISRLFREQNKLRSGRKLVEKKEKVNRFYGIGSQLWRKL